MFFVFPTGLGGGADFRCVIPKPRAFPSGARDLAGELTKSEALRARSLAPPRFARPRLKPRVCQKNGFARDDAAKSHLSESVYDAAITATTATLAASSSACRTRYQANMTS